MSGYNDKLPVLLAAVLERVAAVQAHVPPDRFAVMAEQLRREYANMAFSQVYSWAMYRRGAPAALRGRSLRAFLQRWRRRARAGGGGGGRAVAWSAVATAGSSERGRVLRVLGRRCLPPPPLVRPPPRAAGWRLSAR